MSPRTSSLHHFANLLLALAVAGSCHAGESAARTWKRLDEWNPRLVGRLSRAETAFDYSEARMMRRDDPRWAAPEWDDESWPSGGYHWFPARDGIFWVRFSIRADEGRSSLPDGIEIRSASSYQVFWDGVPIGRNGIPGNSRAEEQPGRVDAQFWVPEHLTGPGEHLVAMRMSTHWTGFPHPLSGFNFRLGESAVIESRRTREAVPLVLGAGAMGVFGVVALLLWLLADRRPALLWLAGLCVAATGMQSLIAVRLLIGYAYQWHYPALVTIAVLVGAMGVCLVGLVLTQFVVPHRRVLVVALVPVLAAAAWLSPARMNREGDWIMLVCFAVSFACIGWAIWQRRRGARVAAAGMLATVALRAPDPTPYILSDLFPNFLPTLFGLVAVVALQLREERREAQQARLSAARLEIELLKKSLQPHFLLNTLTVLTEVIERSPARAVRLIDDLAAEFRLMAAMSAQRTVTLGQEIELCRAHLRVMSVRTGIEYVLDATRIDEKAAVPPALFLTLIENGFSHQRVASSGATFLLRGEPLSDGAFRYTFISPGAVRPVAPARPGGSGGTGLRYVRARLEEIAAGAWRVSQQAVPGGWETVIELGSAKRAAMSG